MKTTHVRTNQQAEDTPKSTDSKYKQTIFRAHLLCFLTVFVKALSPNPEVGLVTRKALDFLVPTHSLHCSSFLGLPFRIPKYPKP